MASSGVQSAPCSSYRTRLPGNLVRPLIVKNTFLDVEEDEEVFQRRSSRRSRTEGALREQTRPEPYDGLASSTVSPESTPRDTSSVEEGPNKAPSKELSCKESRSETEDSIKHVGSSSSGETVSVQRVASISSGETILRQEREGGDPSELAARDEMGATPICHSWAIDAKRLRGNDRSVVSRPFQLALSGPGSAGMTCKMMLYAKALGDNRGGQSFRLSGGQGSLQLKCEHDLSDTHLAPSRLRFSIGLLEGPCPKVVQQKVVQHDFTQSAACSSHDWDFKKAVDKASHTFVVNVEVLPAA